MIESSVNFSSRNRIPHSPIAEPFRVWTDKSIDLNTQTKESFVKECLEDAGMSGIKKITALLKDNNMEKADKISADDFAREDNIVATNENSSLQEEHLKNSTTDQESTNPSSILTIDENYNIAGVSRESNQFPSNIISTSKHKSAVIGSFNIEWLGGCPYKDKRGAPERKEGDYKKIAQVIKDSKAVVMGLQEVVKMEALFKVLKHLPDWGFILSKNKNQKVAFIFDKRRVKFDANSIQNMDKFADPKTFNYGNLRPPLATYMKVDNFDCNFVVVHQKSGFHPKSLKIRNKQSKMFNEWIKDYLKTNNDKDLIVLGDFNDMLGSDSLNAISEGGVLRFSTEELSKDDYTNIPHKGIIDHIGYSTVKKGALEEIKEGTTKTIKEYKYPQYRKWGSDHRPVIVELNTGVDND